MKLSISAVEVPSAINKAISGRVLDVSNVFNSILFGLEQVINSKKHEEFIVPPSELNVPFLILSSSFAYSYIFAFSL